MHSDDEYTYEYYAKNLSGTFARLKILLTEKLAIGTLVIPHPCAAVSFHVIMLHFVCCLCGI